MSTSYFYAIDGKRQGPVRLDELKSLAIKGDLKRQDKVWSKGMKDWAPASKVAELFEDLPPELELDEPVTPPPLPPEDVYPKVRGSIARTSVESLFYPERQVFIAAFPIGVGLIAATFLLASQSSEGETENGFSFALLVLLGCAGLLVAIVNWLKLHYRLTDQLIKFLKTDPGARLWFCKPGA